MEPVYIDKYYDDTFLRDYGNDVKVVIVSPDAETWKINSILLGRCNNIEEFIVEDNDNYCFSNGILYTIIAGKKEISYITNEVSQLIIDEDVSEIGTNAKLRNVEEVVIKDDHPTLAIHGDMLTDKNGTEVYAVLSCAGEAIIPEGIEKIHYNAFVGCKKLKRIVIPESFSWWPLGAPHGGSFWDFSDVPDDVDIVIKDSDARFYCGLIIRSWGKPNAQAIAYSGNPDNCLIPDNIESNLFFNDALNNVNKFIVGEGNEHFASYDGIVTDKSGSILVCFPRTRSTFNIPNTVSAIGRSSCSGNNNLDEVVIPKNVKSIELHAFANCKSIRKVVMENEEVAVDNNAFLGCPLETFEGAKYAGIIAEDIDCDYKGAIRLREGTRELRGGSGPNRPNSLEEVEVQAEVLHFPDSLREIRKLNYPLKCYEVDENNITYMSQDGVLFSKNMKTLIRYPEMKDGTDYTIPEGVEVISSQAFHNCKNLENVILPDSIEKVGEEAFSYTALKTIEIPAKRVDIEKLAITPSTYVGRSGLKINDHQTLLLFRHDEKKIPVELEENWNLNANERDLAFFINTDESNMKKIFSVVKNTSYKRFMALYLYLVYGDEDSLTYLKRAKKKLAESPVYMEVVKYIE